MSELEKLLSKECHDWITDGRCKKCDKMIIKIKGLFKDGINECRNTDNLIEWSELIKKVTEL